MSDDRGARAAVLASEPMRDAGPRRGFVTGTLASVRDILAHRELLGLLVRRELKARYKDSVLGFLWTLIRPIAMLMVYFVALGKFLGGAASTPGFVVFIYTGLTAWTLFSESLMTGTASVVGNAGLVKKVYLPRELFPLAAIGASAVNFLAQLAILVATTAVAGHFPTGDRWWYLPLSLAVLLTYTTALVFLLSAANVGLRDIQYLVDVALLLLFWLSPIVYSWKQVSGNVGSTLITELYLANPMTLVVLGFQRIFWVQGEGQPAPDALGSRLGVALVLGLVLLWLCQRFFARLQANFAQEL